VIFVTVGSQMPFPRLINAVDEWAATTRRTDVFAQIGDASRPPRHIEWVRMLAPGEFRTRVQQADVVVGHAGMGTIITALELGVPLIAMPRRAHLGETRNDHQVATARHFARLGVATPADGPALVQHLARLDELAAVPRIRDDADPSLLDTVAAFVHGR
jgi:UDP-N-acetylglucosamine transferase subunit ALG13